MKPLPHYFPPDFPAPAAPVSGRGAVRSLFPFSLRTNEARKCWDAIPREHKAVGSSRRGFVSPEIFSRLMESQKDF